MTVSLHSKGQKIKLLLRYRKSIEVQSDVAASRMAFYLILLLGIVTAIFLSSWRVITNDLSDRATFFRVNEPAAL